MCHAVSKQQDVLSSITVMIGETTKSPMALSNGKKLENMKLILVILLLH